MGAVKQYVTPQTRKSSEGSTVPDVERRGGTSPWHLASLGADDTSGYRRPDFQYRSSIGLDLYYCILPYFLLRISFDSPLFDMVYILCVLASYNYSVPEAAKASSPQRGIENFSPSLSVGARQGLPSYQSPDQLHPHPLRCGTRHMDPRISAFADTEHGPVQFRLIAFLCQAGSFRPRCRSSMWHRG
jgi:hypothetical protein